MKGRIRLLDILRGIAVLGTLGTNIWIFAHLGDLSFITTYEYSDWWKTEDLMRMTVLFLVNGKLLGLLTLMFGVGMELKYRQMVRKNKAWPGVYKWTAIFLIAEGFLHYVLVMEYDILMSYGVTALIVAFILKRGDRFIARIMKLIGGFQLGVILLITIASLFGGNVSLGSFDDVVALYQTGSWLDQVQYRLSNFLMLRMEAILIIPMNIFLFLLGVRLMRSGVFSPDENGRKQRSKLFKIGIFIGLPLNLLIFVPGGAFDLPVRYLFAPLLSLGYIGLIGKMIEYKKWDWLWRRLEQAGRMSLSCYVMQNMIASVIFYGWGLGLGGMVDSLTIILFWMIISISQLLLASVWGRGFQQGPMEMIRQRTIRLFAQNN
ncbi:uncharacterized protein SAMN04487944_12137 [Gracilibacillus ureilyticus]|uniref:DUF418 domain-containing protein n=2 Tax=Gracilibacillus ureilyticus TaxID=531814 RepID=A0A1H9V5C8_9BACI|nr:uncharacterized protein SAMN04487944_12137 [Gracilibacillus ureilyticus]